MISSAIWRRLTRRSSSKLRGLRYYVLLPALTQGYHKGELLFDTITEMSFESEDAYKAFLASPA